MTTEILPQTKNAAEMAAFYKGLNELLQECGPETNKHDRVIVSIIACIDSGIDTRSHIIGVLKPLGFNHKHVALILKKLDGSDRNRPYWKRNEDGIYSNID